MRPALLALALLTGSAGAAHMSSCAQLKSFGLGELGSLPSWATPDCSAAALFAERNTVASTTGVLFIQSYTAALAAFGGERVAHDLQARLRRAGYGPLASRREGNLIRTTYVSSLKGRAYSVVMTATAPYRMQLVKTRLEAR